MAHQKNEWHSGKQVFLARIKETTRRLRDGKARWNIPDTMLTEADRYISSLDVLIRKDDTLMTKEDRTYCNSLIKEARDFFLNVVRNWIVGQYAMKLIQLFEVHLLGFTVPGEGGGNHERLSIPTEICILQVATPNVDQLYCVVERDKSIAFGEGSGRVRPKGTNGALIAYRLESQTDDDWRYYYTSKIHTRLVMPHEWRGKRIVVKAAYVAHANDNDQDKHRRALPWSAIQFLLLLHAVEDKDIE